MARESGVIRNWGAKGYGFIETRGADDVFVHVTQCPDGRPLQVGTQVEFGVSEDRFGRGRRARDVVIIDAVPDNVRRPRPSLRHVIGD